MPQLTMEDRQAIEDEILFMQWRKLRREECQREAEAQVHPNRMTKQLQAKHKFGQR